MSGYKRKLHRRHIKRGMNTHVVVHVDHLVNGEHEFAERLESRNKRQINGGTVCVR